MMNDEWWIVNYELWIMNYELWRLEFSLSIMWYIWIVQIRIEAFKWHDNISRLDIILRKTTSSQTAKDHFDATEKTQCWFDFNLALWWKLSISKCTNRWRRCRVKKNNDPGHVYCGWTSTFQHTHHMVPIRTSRWNEKLSLFHVMTTPLNMIFPPFYLQW